MAKAIGIDLGSFSVKVSVLERHLGRWSFVDFLEAPVPGETETHTAEPPGGEPPEGEEAGPAAGTTDQATDEVEPELPIRPYGRELRKRIEVLGSLLEEHGLIETSKALAFPAERVSVHSLDLPFTDRGQIERTLPFEVENHVPFEIENMVLDHRILDTEAGRSRILASLVDEETFQDLLEALAQEAVVPKHVAVDAELLSVFADEGVQAVVDLGHTRTLVSLVVDGQTVWFRGIDLGGEHITGALAREFDLTTGAAQRFKHELGVEIGADDDDVVVVPVELESDLESDLESGEITGEEPQDPAEPPDPLDFSDPAGEKTAPAIERAAMVPVLREALQDLLSEIRSTLVAFEEREDREIDEVLLCGGTASLRGIVGWFTEWLGVPVRRVELHDRVQEMGEGAHRFGLVQAVGMRAVGEVRGRPLEFRRGQFAHTGYLDVLRGLASYVVAATVFFLIGGVVVFALERQELSGEVESLDEQISQQVLETFPDTDPSMVEDPSMAVAIMQEQSMGTTTRVDVLGSAVRGEPLTLTLLKELSEAMPPHKEATIDVKEMVLSETALSFEAETDGYEEAARIEASLQNTERFKNANKGDEKKVRDKVVFNVSIPLVGDDEQSEEAEG